MQGHLRSQRGDFAGTCPREVPASRSGSHHRSSTTTRRESSAAPERLTRIRAPHGDALNHWRTAGWAFWRCGNSYRFDGHHLRFGLRLDAAGSLHFSNHLLESLAIDEFDVIFQCELSGLPRKAPARNYDRALCSPRGLNAEQLTHDLDAHFPGFPLLGLDECLLAVFGQDQINAAIRANSHLRRFDRIANLTTHERPNGEADRATQRTDGTSHHSSEHRVLASFCRLLRL